MINWNSVWENVIANLIAASIISSLVALLLLSITLSRRTRRLRVLGLPPGIDQLVLPIYVSRLDINPNGANTTSGKPSKSFAGKAVPIREIEACEEIISRLRKAWIDRTSTLFAKRFSRLSRGFTRLRFAIRIAPALEDRHKVERSPITIIVGGPEFNALSEYYFDLKSGFRICEPEECTAPLVELSATDGTKQRIVPYSTGYNLGIVQRIRIQETGNTVLLLCGIGSNGTLAAIWWFVQHWDRLGKLYGDEDFGVCLECPSSKMDALGYQRAATRAQFPDVMSRLK